MKSKKNILPNLKNSLLDANTILTVKAYHKETGEEFSSEMTLAKWYGLKKSKDYFYKALQCIK